MKIREIICEIGYSDKLISLRGKTFDLSNSEYVGTWYTLDIHRILDSGHWFYFVKNTAGNSFDAYVAILPSKIMNRYPLVRMENISGESGLVSSLIAFLVAKLDSKLIIPDTEQLTRDSIEWVIKISRSGGRGFTITDQHGDEIDDAALRSEWETAKQKGIPGPTAIFIENKNLPDLPLFESYDGMLMPLTVLYGDSELL